MGYDVYIYNGDIERSGYWDLTKAIEKRKKEKGLRNDVVFCVSTYGGDPNAGFRIGRALQHHYKDVSVFVVGPCKSAGTLLAISANRLIIGDTGELGPLDVQLQRKDEIGELTSGLDTIEATNNILNLAVSCFWDCLHRIRLHDRVSTKLAADIAVKLAGAVISPLSSQIDPVRLSSHSRAMNIALAYGRRLNENFKNLKDDAIYKLATSYPSHGFVIDRKEARALFARVISPDKRLLEFYNLYAQLVNSGELKLQGTPVVFDWTEGLAGGEEEKNDEHNETNDETVEKKATGANDQGSEQQQPNINTDAVGSIKQNERKPKSVKKG